MTSRYSKEVLAKKIVGSNKLIGIISPEWYQTNNNNSSIKAKKEKQIESITICMCQENRIDNHIGEEQT